MASLPTNTTKDAHVSNKAAIVLSNWNQKWMIATIILLVIFVIYMFFFPPVQGSKEALAEVNGVTISKDQLYESLYISGGEQALQVLIENELIRQEAEEAGVTIQDEDIEQEIETVKQGFSSAEEFNEALTYYGMTLDGMKADLAVQLKMKKILEPEITITEEHIQQYYNENLETLKTPEEIKASHIVLATKEEADKVLADLRNGADFAEVAKEKSLDTMSKEVGGNLDFITRGSRDELFDTAAFALEMGKLSEVVETSEGFHIIKVMARNTEIIPTLEEKADEIRELLINEEVTTLSSAWMEEIQAKSTIKLY